MGAGCESGIDQAANRDMTWMSSKDIENFCKASEQKCDYRLVKQIIIMMFLLRNILIIPTD